MRGQTTARRLVAIVAILAGSACGSTPPDTRDYATRIEAARADKNTHFMKDEKPVPAERKAELLPLSYFTIDPDYVAPAVLKPGEDRTVLQMPTSTGGQRQMRRVGTLEFSLKSQSLKLTAFVEVGAANLDHLFVPFTDLTTGTETYAAGRYIDLDRTPTGIYNIDFNLAYHPYCYYSVEYDCPYPPAENRLKVPVRAGERLKRPNT
jgi:uncharacterized protein (DUF1684 family)